mgnify:CR=1 FL=1
MSNKISDKDMLAKIKEKRRLLEKIGRASCRERV